MDKHTKARLNRRLNKNNISINYKNSSGNPKRYAIIAKYKENIEWLEELENYNIILLDKSSEKSLEKTSFDEYKAKLKRAKTRKDYIPDLRLKPYENIPEYYHMYLPNIGRESHTYLYYIIQNYEHLDGLYCFLQARPFDHTPDPKNFTNLLNNITESNIQGYQEFGRRSKARIARMRRKPTGLWGSINMYYHLVRIYPRLFHKKCPRAIYFHQGAQFALTGKQIRKRPKSFYEECLKVHYENWISPWAFEIIWPVIWDYKLEEELNNTEPKPTKEEEDIQTLSE